MRACLIALLAATTMALFTNSLSAAPFSAPVPQNATPVVQLAQYDANHHLHHPCAPHYHWECFYARCSCYRDGQRYPRIPD